MAKEKIISWTPIREALKTRILICTSRITGESFTIDVDEYPADPADFIFVNGVKAVLSQRTSQSDPENKLKDMLAHHANFLDGNIVMKRSSGPREIPIPVAAFALWQKIDVAIAQKNLNRLEDDKKARVLAKVPDEFYAQAKANREELVDFDAILADEDEDTED